MAHPGSVISPNYCAPHPVDLAIVKKAMTSGNFDVIDVEGNVVFKVKEPFSFFRGRSLLLDAAGNPLVTLRPKLTSMHSTWKAFRGDSTDSGDLLFSVKRSSLFQFKTTLDVFLANNTREDVCDFKAKGSFSQRSCVIYAGNSSTIVAQIGVFGLRQSGIGSRRIRTSLLLCNSRYDLKNPPWVDLRIDHS